MSEYGAHTQYYVATDDQLVILCDMITDKEDLSDIMAEMARRGILARALGW